jgi:uncharacterized protein (DUF111 family)
MSFMERCILDREMVTVGTRYGNIRCKLGKLSGEVIKHSPEYEDCKSASMQYGVTIAEVYAEAAVCLKEKLQ